MSSVTQRINEIKQPTGGYINPNMFTTIEIVDEYEIKDVRPIIKSNIGLAVDYLTRYYLLKEKNPDNALTEAFKISLLGASLVGQLLDASCLLHKIGELNEKTVLYALNLVRYDIAYRVSPDKYVNKGLVYYSSDVINNIIIMVKRSLKFAKEYGPIIKTGFDFEGGYSDIITAGDGDFMTEDTLWDFKTSKNEPNAKQILQLLIYYLLGIHSLDDEFLYVERLGIFNPELNKVYLLNLKDVPNEVFYKVSKDVIGYEMLQEDYESWLLINKEDSLKDILQFVSL